MSSCCFSTKPEPGLQKPVQGIWNFATFSLSDSQLILILDICYLTESNTTVLPHVLRIILSNMVKLLEINFWKWAKWMCIFHAVLIQRDLFFFFKTICARNAYLGSKLEYEIFLPREMNNFLPSFKQLRIKSDCDGWRELSNIARCDSCLSPTKSSTKQKAYK